MGKYTYKCDKCDAIVTLDLRMSDAGNTQFCPLCDSEIRRYIGAVPAVRYNGTGFASTDIPRKSGIPDDYVS